MPFFSSWTGIGLWISSPERQSHFTPVPHGLGDVPDFGFAGRFIGISIRERRLGLPLHLFRAGIQQPTQRVRQVARGIAGVFGQLGYAGGFYADPRTYGLTVGMKF